MRLIFTCTGADYRSWRCWWGGGSRDRVVTTCLTRGRRRWWRRCVVVMLGLWPLDRAPILPIIFLIFVAGHDHAKLIQAKYSIHASLEPNAYKKTCCYFTHKSSYASATSSIQEPTICHICQLATSVSRADLLDVCGWFHETNLLGNFFESLWTSFGRDNLVVLQLSHGSESGSHATSECSQAKLISLHAIFQTAQGPAILSSWHLHIARNGLPAHQPMGGYLPYRVNQNQRERHRCLGLSSSIMPRKKLWRWKWCHQHICMRQSNVTNLWKPLQTPI